MKKPDKQRLERIATEAARAREAREQTYREQALKMYPHVCGRCGREFAGKNLRELTVHHRDHNHDNNPPDGSNWELLCVYCHDNEHQKQLEAQQSRSSARQSNAPTTTHNPFANLKDMMKGKDE